MGQVPTPASGVPNARWRRTGFLLFLVYLVAFAERANISVAVPSMSLELGLTATAAGVVLSAFFWGYVVTQVPGGWLANRVGPTRVIWVALIIWGLTSIAQALSPSAAALIVCRVVMGLSEGVVWPSFAILFINWFPVAERARAAGLSLLALPISSVIMAPSAGWLIARWNWETMFVVQGLPAFVLAVFVALYLRDDPTQDRRLSSAELHYILQHRPQRSGTLAARSFVSVLKTPAVWACCLIYFLWLTGFYSFSLWLPTLLKELSSQGIEAVGWLTAIPFAVAGAAMLVNSIAADRSGLSKSWFVVPPLLLAAASLLIQHVVPASLGVQLVFLTLTGVGVYAAFGAWWAWVLQHIHPEQAGPASGMVNVFGSFGGVVGPVVVGYAASGGPAAQGFYVLGFFLLAAGFVALAMARATAPRACAVSEPG